MSLLPRSIELGIVSIKIELSRTGVTRWGNPVRAAASLYLSDIRAADPELPEQAGFMDSPGTGKTRIVETIAEYLVENPRTVIRIELQQIRSVRRLGYLHDQRTWAQPR